MQPIENTNNSTKFYSVAEVRKILGVGRNNAYRLVSRHDFPAIHIGNRIIVPADLFKLWIDTQVVNRRRGEKNGR